MMMMNFMQPNAFTAQVVETMRLKYYLARSIIRSDTDGLKNILESKGLKRYAHLVLVEGITIPGHGNESPLTRAAQLGRTECFKLLVKKLVELQSDLTTPAVLRILETALYMSTGRYPSAACQNILLDTLKESCSDVVLEALLKAVICDNVESTKLFIAYCPDIDLREIRSIGQYLLQSSPKGMEVLNLDQASSDVDKKTLQYAFRLACTCGAVTFVKEVLNSGYPPPIHFDSNSKTSTLRSVVKSRCNNRSDIIRLLLSKADEQTQADFANSERNQTNKSLLHLAMDEDDAEAFQVISEWEKSRKSSKNDACDINSRWLSELLTISGQICNLKSANCLKLFLHICKPSLCIDDIDNYLQMVAQESNYFYSRELLEFRHMTCVQLGNFPPLQLSQIILVAGQGKDQLVHSETADLKCILEYFRFGYTGETFSFLLQQFLYLKLSMLPGPYRMHLEQVITDPEQQRYLFLFICLFFQGSPNRNVHVRKALFDMYTQQFVSVKEADFLMNVIPSIGWEFIYRPTPLTIQCRDKIRSLNTESFHPKWIDSLNIPHGLKSFLNFNDLESVIREVQEIERESILSTYARL